MECQMPNDYLAHHGIKGQKWGVRRYQNSDGSLTAEGRRRRGYSSDKPERKSLSERRKEKAAENAATKHENLKKYVREHPKALYKNRAEFSEQEINDIVKTIQADRRLKDIRNEEVRRQWDRIQDISNNLGKVKNLAENAKGIYNMACDINNTLIETGTFKNGKRMVKVGERAEKQGDGWFDKNLKASNYTELLKNKDKLTNSQLTEINKRFTQEELIKKNFGEEPTYEGKHIKHCLGVRVGDIIPA